MNSSRFLTLCLLSGALIMEANASNVNKKSKTDDGKQTTASLRDSSSGEPSENSEPALGKRSREHMLTSVGDLVVPPSRGGNPANDQAMAQLLKQAQNGDQQALNQLREASANDKTASFLMAKFYFEPSQHVQRDLNAALEYLSKPCFVKSNSGQLLKAKLHMELQQYDQALTAYKSCNQLCHSATKSDHREACYQIGCIYQKGLGLAAADEFQAHHWFKRAADLKQPDATYKLALLYLGKANATLHDLQTALTYMTEARKLYRNGPENALRNVRGATAEIHYRMGMLYEQSASKYSVNCRAYLLDMDKALDHRIQAAALGNEKAKAGLGDKLMALSNLHLGFLDEPEHHAYHGNMRRKWLLEAFDSGHPDAKNALEVVLVRNASKWPKHVQIEFYHDLDKRGFQGAKERLSQAYYEEGLFQRTHNNRQGAESSFLNAANSGCTAAWGALGDMYTQDGQVQRAAECYEKCPDAKEKVAALRLQEAKSWLVGPNQNKVKAITLLEQALTLSAESNKADVKDLLIKTACDVAQGLAHSEALTGELDLAKEMYAKAVALGSRQAEIGLKHVEVLVTKNRLREGDVSVKSILAKQLCDLAGMYLKDDKLAQALEYVSEAADLGSTDAMCIAGAIYAKQRKPHEAEALLRKSALMNNSFAQKRLVDFYLDGIVVPTKVYEAMKWMLASGQVDRRLKLEALFKAGHKGAFPVKRNRQVSALSEFLTYSDRISEAGQDAVCPALQKAIHEIVHLASRVNVLASDLIQEPILGTCYEMTPLLAEAHVNPLRGKDDPEFLHEYRDSKGVRYLTIGVDAVRKVQDLERLMAVENKDLLTPEVKRQVVEGMACHMVWKALKEANQQQACEALYQKAAQVVNLPDLDSIRSLSCFLQLVGKSCNEASILLSSFNGSAVRYLLAQKGADVNDEIWQKVMTRAQKLCEAEKQKLFYINGEKDKFVGSLVSALHKDLEERIAAVGARNKAMTDLPIVQAISRAQPVHIDLLYDK